MALGQTGSISLNGPNQAICRPISATQLISRPKNGPSECEPSDKEHGATKAFISCLFPKQTCIAVAYDSTLPWCAPRHQSSRTSAAVGSHEWPQHLQLLLELQKLQQHHADKTTANPAGPVMEVEGGDIPEEDEATEYTRMEVTPQDLVHDVGP